MTKKLTQIEDTAAAAKRNKLTAEELDALHIDELRNILPYEHIVFAEEYIISLNKSQAYKISRGIDPNEKVGNNIKKQAYDLLKKSLPLQIYIRKLMDMKSEERIAKQDEVLEFLSDVMRNNYSKLGYDRNLYVKDRITAAELLGKRYALFTDKIQGNIQLEALQIEIIDAEPVSDVNED